MNEMLMKMGTQASAGESLELTTRLTRVRRGCDKCKRNYPTEKFMGYCGNTLWICEACFTELVNWDGQP